MTEQRYGYTYHRVLIDSARVLDSQFADAVIYVTGAQLELLRNMTQYLNRLSSYVSSYHPDYYLSPTVEDYDGILAIVADLEHVLMGNPNTIFGYNDYFYDADADTVSGAGTKTLYGSGVPEGEVWRIEDVGVINENTVCTKIHVVMSYPGGTMIIGEAFAAPANTWTFFPIMLTMPPSSDLSVKFYGCEDGDYIRFDYRGYILAVP